MLRSCQGSEAFAGAEDKELLQTAPPTREHNTVDLGKRKCSAKQGWRGKAEEAAAAGVDGQQVGHPPGLFRMSQTPGRQQKLKYYLGNSPGSIISWTFVQCFL